MPDTRSSQRRKTGPGPGSGPDSDTEMPGQDGGVQDLFAGLKVEMERALTATLAKFEERIKRQVAAVDEAIGALRGEVASVQQQVAAAAQSAAAAARAESEATIAALADKVVGLEQRVERQDRAGRLCSVVLHGLADAGRGEPTKDKVQRLLQGVDPADVLEARRLGRAAAGRARPILVRLASVEAKHGAFRSGKALRAQKVFVDEDLTAAQRDRRKELRGRYAERRDKGWGPFWRGDRLLYGDGDRLGEDSGHGPIGPAPSPRTRPGPPPQAPSSGRAPGRPPVQRPPATPAARSASAAPTPPSPPAAQRPPSAAPPPPPSYAAAASGRAAASGEGAGPGPSGATGPP